MFLWFRSDFVQTVQSLDDFKTAEESVLAGQNPVLLARNSAGGLEIGHDSFGLESFARFQPRTVCLLLWDALKPEVS
jgi:hypothetical protein